MASQKKISFDFFAPSIESTSIVNIKSRYSHFINGKFTAHTKNNYFNSINPATEKKITKLSNGTKADIDKAVKAANNAYHKVWSKMPAANRGKYLFRIARIIQERAREFAVLETIDGGKPIKESRDVDVPLCAAHFFYNAGWADKLDYLHPGKKATPRGVVGAIIPWNFPLLMAAWKIAPAIATGNTIVLKPAETTSLTALLLAEVFQQAELPDGVVNIVTGAGPTGKYLVDHPLVKKIAFTGSTDVGKAIFRATSGTDKKLTLELGGKSAHIIYADAAIDQAIEGIVNGIYFNQGHVCCAGSRLLVEEPIKNTVINKLKKRMEQLRVGNPLDKNSDIGAINSLEQLQKIKDLVKIGSEEGSELFIPKKYTKKNSLPVKGFFHPPCFFTKVASNHTIYRTEIFGPVLSITTFRTPEDAISKANDSTYGLAAGIWSEKSSKILKTAQELKAGIIWANTYNKFDPSSPFGGFKESGFGREGGMHGLFPYLEFN